MSAVKWGHDELPADFRRLVEKFCDGALSGDDGDRLDRLVAGDLRAAQAFAEIVGVHSQLRLLGRAETEPFGSVVPFPARRRASRPALVFGSFAAAVAATAAVVFVFATGLLGDPFLPPIEGVVVATSADVEFGGGEAWAQGRIVRRGDLIDLTAGLVSVRNRDGAVVDLRSPTLLQFDGRNRVRLRAGSLRAVVPAEAKGFTVATETVEVVDLGTEFAVSHSFTDGSRVDVRRGRVEGFRLVYGRPVEMAEIVAGEAVGFTDSAMFAAPADKLFGWFDETKGGIVQLHGNVRVATNGVIGLDRGDTRLASHVLVVPERRDVDRAELAACGIDVPDASGSVVSYLLHFDPGKTITKPPKGRVDFGGRVLRTITSDEELNATDAAAGHARVRYPDEVGRGLEFDASGGSDGDRVTVGGDGRSVAFRFETDTAEPLEQCRILVLE